MRDLTSFASMKLKAALFIFIGLFSGALVVFGSEFSAWQRALFLVMCVWAFCRVYYFAFYVIEKFVDPSFKFSGLGMAVKYVMGRSQAGGPTSMPYTDPPPAKTAGLPKRWWLLWWFTMGLASIVPVFHLRENLRELIEPLRYPWGLLPVQWLSVWAFEKLSWYVLTAVIILGIFAWAKPSRGRAAILSAMVLYALFSSCHVRLLARVVMGAVEQQVQNVIDERAKAQSLEKSP